MAWVYKISNGKNCCITVISDWLTALFEYLDLHTVILNLNNYQCGRQNGMRAGDGNKELTNVSLKSVLKLRIPSEN